MFASNENRRLYFFKELFMFAPLFDFSRDRPNLRSIVARDVQAYYDKHAGGDTSVRRFKWLGAMLLALVCFAASANNEALAAEVPDQTDSAFELPVTVFIDGPTGFVFVYPAEGWKFVRTNPPAE
jgi:hypothetical protein